MDSFKQLFMQDTPEQPSTQEKSQSLRGKFFKKIFCVAFKMIECLYYVLKIIHYFNEIFLK